MSLNRRDFVASVGCSFLASTAARAHVSWPDKTPLAKDYFDWATLRAEFDLSPEWLHFAQLYIVSHPRPVRAAIERYRRMLDANPFATVEHGMGFEAWRGVSHEETRPECVQREAADYIGGGPVESAVKDSTTEG